MPGIIRQDSRDFLARTSLGRVNGGSAFVIAGNAAAIQTAEAPCLLWDLKTPFVFQAAAQSLEILSSSANDAAAGTGARTILVQSLDADLNEVSTIVTMNGTTPVVLAGAHLHVNLMVLATHGSGNVNAGNITLRVAGGGAVQGYIAAGVGMMRAFKFTVPAGKIGVITSFFANANNATGSNIVVTSSFKARLPSGLELNTLTNYFSGGSGPAAATLPLGFPVPTGYTIYNTVDAVSANNASMALSAVCGLYTLNQI